MKNFILTITHDTMPDGKPQVNISFEGDSEMLMSAIMKGIKTFVDDANDKCEAPSRTTTLGDVYPK
jgi:hypothetical protein